MRANIAVGKKERKSEMIGGDGWTVLFRQSFFMVDKKTERNEEENGGGFMEEAVLRVFEGFIFLYSAEGYLYLGVDDVCGW